MESPIVTRVQVQDIECEEQIVEDVLDVPVADSLHLAIVVVDGQVLATIVILEPADLGRIDNVNSITITDDRRHSLLYKRGTSLSKK